MRALTIDHLGVKSHFDITEPEHCYFICADWLLPNFS